MSAVNEPASTSAVSSVSTAGRAPTPGSTGTGDPFNPEGVAFQPVSRRLIAVRVVGILLGLGALAAVFVVGALVRYSWMWVGAGWWWASPRGPFGSSRVRCAPWATP